ncbi:lysophospholipase I [Daedalea quercina L-15889]|uniref:Acyl-protein thioesterase 1 n=1 Tax=Daedalea quercina L-15889 TaxID=1314783 RepID=A0A165R5C6_9APHY|nr:lysophospholipase I [Daedalea quercina L-15889]
MARVTYTPQRLEKLTVPAREKHTATVIFAHGLDESGANWMHLAEVLSRDPELRHIKYIFPHAPVMAISAKFGMRMPAWYDVISFESVTTEGDSDDFGMLRSIANLGALVEAEINAGIPPERIIFGGFRQGGCMALLTGLTYEHELGGLILLSGRLQLGKKVKLLMQPRTLTTPIFWGHGVYDTMVSFDAAERSLAHLRRECGLADADPDAPEKGGVLIRKYNTAGFATEEELKDVKEWMKRVIPAEPAQG